MLTAGGRDEGRSLPPCRYPSGAEAGSGCYSAGREHPLPAPTRSPSRRCSAPPQPQPRSVPISGRSPAAAAPFPYGASWILPATHCLPSAPHPVPAPPGALPGHKPHRMPPRPSLPLTNNPELPAVSLVLRGQQETAAFVRLPPDKASPFTRRQPRAPHNPRSPTPGTSQPYRFWPPPQGQPCLLQAMLSYSAHGSSLQFPGGCQMTRPTPKDFRTFWGPSPVTDLHHHPLPSKSPRIPDPLLPL